MKKELKKILSNRFINAIVFGAGGAVISKGLFLLFNIIVARILSEKQYGIYSIINNTVQTFTVFAGAGLGVTLSRYVALYREKDKNLAGISIKTLLIFNIILSLFISLIMFAFSNNISDLLSKKINISFYLKITSFTLFFTSVALILQSILQGFEKYKNIAVVLTLTNLISLVLGVILSKYYDIIGTIFSLLMLQLILCILFVILIYKIIKEKNIPLKFEVNDVMKDAIKNVALPAFLASIFVIPVLWVTNFYFTRVNGYESFAAFSVCLQWFTILNYIPQQFGQVKPILTQLYDDGNKLKMKKVVKKLIIISVLFALLSAFILAACSGFLLKFYGEFYSDYRMPFIIILIASIFFSLQSQCGSVFQAIGKVWVSFLLNVIWAIVFCISFFVTINLGILGYCLTYLISYLIYGIISCIILYKYVK